MTQSIVVPEGYVIPTDGTDTSEQNYEAIKGKDGPKQSDVVVTVPEQTVYTDYAIATEKLVYNGKHLPSGKKYYIRGWISYSIYETTDYFYINFTAGLQTKAEKVTLSPVKVSVYDTEGNLKTAEAEFKGATTTTKQTYIDYGWFKYERPLSEKKVVTIKLDTCFDQTIFSGEDKTLSFDLAINPSKAPYIQFQVERNDQVYWDVTTDAYMTLRVVKNDDVPGLPTIDSITVKRDGVTISPTWKDDADNTIMFPYTLVIPKQNFHAYLDNTINEMNEYTYTCEFVSGAHNIKRGWTVPALYNKEWKRNVSVSGQPLPDIFDNKARVKIYAKDYARSTLNNDVFVLLPNDGGWDIEITDSTHWSIPVTLTEKYVDDPTSHEANATLKIVYNYYTDAEVKDKVAIFNTTRVANYSTGLANNIFIGGCKLPDYSSRVWYSAVNDPTYMPDTNFVEVGSNDTQVMGLVKVGDYLGVVKQSKSIDSSVFLIYPTSFDDETTFATKPCVAGVGALGKYCFNVLGDETLFLSPRGIMAIEPSENEQSRVKDRSFFVNGKLLTEPHLEDAYSFVWNGFYMLAVNNHVYVLDGNQRNSWGNTKTNLVYECYFLDNVPAKTLFSYDGELWFSDFDGNICRFKKKTDPDPYSDNGENIFAEWSTIADDDGALHYYKTLQKKGNVVSLLPEDGTSALVYLKKDEEQPMLIKGANIDNPKVTLPVSIYAKKKVKKYKRLQFIIRDDSTGPFGIDEIIKSYTVGNYAKK